MKTHVWIIGKGMLGSCIARDIERMNTLTLWAEKQKKFDWQDEEKCEEQMNETMKEFAQSFSNESHWTIIWSAGTGSMSSAKQALEKETRIFSSFLRLLDENQLSQKRGTVFFASSVSVYGSQNCNITEYTKENPQSPYAREKIKQEKLIRTWATSHESISVLIGRISSLFGSGQNLQKNQGLLSHMSRSIILKKPINIYVPLDTKRNYLYVNDCSKYILNTLEHIIEQKQKYALKIFASDQTTTIATIIGIFMNIAKKKPRIILCQTAQSHLYNRRIQLQSVILAETMPQNRTSLSVGIAQLHREQLQLYQQGKLITARNERQ